MRDLLDLLDGDSGRSSARRSVDVERLLLSCVKMARSATDHRVHTVTEFTRVPEIVTNEARLSQALLHLLVSVGDVALLSGQLEPTVRVVTRSLADRVLVCVTTDRPLAVFDAIGDPDSLGGALELPRDVGLAICQHLTERLGGTMRASTTENLEMTVGIELPIEAERARSAVDTPFSSVRPPRHRLGRP
jgi:signal transduction histidine kinase